MASPLLSAPASNVFSGFPNIKGAPHAAIQNSRYSFVKTNAFYAVSFVNPVLSGALATTVVSVLIARSLFDFSVVAIILHCAVATMVVSAAIHVYNTVNHVNITQLRLPLDRGSVNQLGVS